MLSACHEPLWGTAEPYEDPASSVQQVCYRYRNLASTLLLKHDFQTHWGDSMSNAVCLLQPVGVSSCTLGRAFRGSVG